MKRSIDVSIADTQAGAPNENDDREALAQELSGPYGPVVATQKRSGPQPTRRSKIIEGTIIGLLVTMIVFGFVVILIALRTGFSDHSVQDATNLAYKGLAVSAFLTGITTIYCGLTGFILLESRRMRLQAIMPHVQFSSPVRSTEAILLELQNAGAAPAVDLEIRAWVLKLVGGTRTPEPAAVFLVNRPALPASPVPQQIKLLQKEHECFKSWTENVNRAGIPEDALDPYLLLVEITYRAVDGREMSECLALPLSDQQQLPGGPP